MHVAFISCRTVQGSDGERVGGGGGAEFGKMSTLSISGLLVK